MRSSADLAVLGARIRTLDPARPWATAVAWRDGAIVAVGDDADVREPPATRAPRSIDGRGLALVPGLVDSHQHPLMGADERSAPTSPGSRRSTRCAPRCGRARALRAGQWVRGHSLEYATFDGAGAAGALVADAVGGAPALLTFFDFHTALATPAALAAAGIDGPRALDGSARDRLPGRPPDGRAARAAGLEPVAARHAAADARGARSRAREPLRRMAARGLTAVHGMDGSPATHDELRELEARGELCVRIVAPLHVEPDDAREELERWTRCATRTVSAGAAACEVLHRRRRRAGHRLARGARRERAGLVPSGPIRSASPAPSRSSRARASSARRTRSATARCAARSTPTAPPARRRACATASSTSRRSATSSSRASPRRASPPRCRRSTCSGCAPTAATPGRARSAPSAPAARSAAPTSPRSGALLALGSDWPVAHFDPRAGMAWARLRRPPGDRDRAPVGPPRR